MRLFLAGSCWIASSLTDSALSLRNNTLRCIIASSSNPPLLCLYVMLCVHVLRVEQARKRDRCASVILKQVLTCSLVNIVISSGYTFERP